MAPRLQARAILALVGVAALLLTACGSSHSPEAGSRAELGLVPSPNRAVPNDPARLADELRRVTAGLEARLDRWLRAGPGVTEKPPEEVTLHALYQQRIYLKLQRNPRLADAALGRLPRLVARSARNDIVAGRKLAKITGPAKASAIRTGPAPPPVMLLRYYRQAERRFRVSWEVLAAVNFVESAFGRVRSPSGASARGPMQFLASTWRAYGRGGDVHDPHDAIVGAANHLRANGAPSDYRNALYAYNPSASYVNAVLRYASEIRRDRRAYFTYYSRQVFVRTRTGARRLTGPGMK